MIESPLYMENSEESQKVSSKTRLLISAYEDSQEIEAGQKKISVNRVVSEVASWYEKLRNAMDYRADEVILRAAIERILKRRVLLLGGKGKSVAGPLVRELIWARYFPDATIPEVILESVAVSIDLYLYLRDAVLQKHKIGENKLDELIFHLLSSDLEQILNPNREEDTMRNFMFQILRNNVVIGDDSEETRDAQVFIAVCKNFSKDDIPFLHAHLFRLFFGEITAENMESIASGFMDYYKEIEKQLQYKRKDRVNSYIRNQTSPFLILRDIFKKYEGSLLYLVENHDTLKKAVFEACEAQYKSIATKVQRAIVRSVIFILLTKALFALTVEGTYETIIFGGVVWGSMLINISIPPLLMILVGMFIRPPGRDNSDRIFTRIQTIIFDESPKMGEPFSLNLQSDKNRPVLGIIFSFLWLGAFILSFGLLYFALSKLGFNIVNKGVFIFFFTIVSFLSYRISEMATVYSFQPKQGLMTPIVDFLFLPIIRVGRRLTEGIAQLNLLLFILDFIIETPFKGMFSFFEQWFVYLHTKREEMG